MTSHFKRDILHFKVNKQNVFGRELLSTKLRKEEFSLNAIQDQGVLDNVLMILVDACA